MYIVCPVHFHYSQPTDTNSQVYHTKKIWQKGPVRGKERKIPETFLDSTTPMSHALSRHSDSGEKHTRNTDCLQQRGSGTASSNRHTAGVGGNSAGSRSAINLKEYFTKEPSSASTSDPLQSSSTCSKKRRTSDSSHPNHSSKESGSHPAKRKKRNSHSAESPLAEEKTMSSLPSQSTSAFKNGVHPVIRSNSTESGPTSVTKSRQAKKLVIKNFKGMYIRMNELVYDAEVTVWACHCV